MSSTPTLFVTPEMKADLKNCYGIDASWLRWEYQRRFGKILKVVPYTIACETGSCDHDSHKGSVDVHLRMVSDASPGFTLQWVEKE
jgi:hypothetical protein